MSDVGRLPLVEVVSALDKAKDVWQLLPVGVDDEALRDLAGMGYEVRKVIRWVGQADTAES